MSRLGISLEVVHGLMDMIVKTDRTCYLILSLGFETKSLWSASAQKECDFQPKDFLVLTRFTDFCHVF